MLVMHFYFVYNMNKIGRVFIICILISATTGADELISKYKTSTTTTKWKEPTTTPKWKEPTASPRWKEPTTTPRWKEPTASAKWKETTTTPKWIETTTSPKWKKQTTTPRWKESTTTTDYKKTISTWKSPVTTTKNKEPITVNKYKGPTTSTKWKSPTEWKRIAPVNHGAVAYAGFSGLDARNGRLSSMNGIKVFPSLGSSMVKTDNKGNFILKQVNGKMPMPITITKQGDGVSGTIRILPGSVSVSSSASSSSKSGPVSAVASYSPWKSSFMKPVMPMDDMYFQPFPTFPTIPDPMFDTRFPDTSFHTKMLDPYPFMKISEPSFEPRIQDPWFDKNMFKQSRPRHDMYRTNWFYPSFNPYFNYW